MRLDPPIWALFLSDFGCLYGSHARSVPKPLKVPSLARSVPKPLMGEARGHQSVRTSLFHCEWNDEMIVK